MTLKTAFDHSSQLLLLGQKYSATRRIFNALLGVWKCAQTQSFVFDILFENCRKSADVKLHRSAEYTISDMCTSSNSNETAINLMYYLSLVPRPMKCNHLPFPKYIGE